MSELPPYAHSGARALVALHERHLRAFVATWKRALEVRPALPVTDDADYASLETIGVHVFACAQHYMNWICEKLDLADPGIHPAPTPEDVVGRADAYLEHVLEAWRQPLSQVDPGRFEERCELSRWGRRYSMDSMLEHAVMHPIRHEFQLNALM